MSAKPVDVLAVLVELTAQGLVKPSRKNENAGFIDMRDWYALQPRISAARAAVAELIEADKELDDASEAHSHVVMTDGYLSAGEAWNRVQRAKLRRSAALARVQGGGA